MKNYAQNGRRGSTLLEFVLVGIFIFVPLTLGTASVGMTLARSILVCELNRNAGRMLAQGTDFSQAAGRALLLRLAKGLNITDTGGDGVVILSVIQSTGAGQAVCTRRYVIGNAALRSSSYVNPQRIDTSGAVDYLNDPAANANAVLSLLPMSAGETCFLVETYYRSSDFDWAGFWTGKGTYMTAVF